MNFRNTNQIYVDVEDKFLSVSEEQQNYSDIETTLSNRKLEAHDFDTLKAKWRLEIVYDDYSYCG